ncbi:MAG: LLM class F420-dependent oxidoreductase [Rhodospirillaceae bacterium]|nr:LLM class F420-dependent oxidoreductase [Rhodospirillaceae bacterium]MBT7732108.1 LLM class F420-dependent oxidoreductase [Rhodospirillaceae bacterium]MDG1887674.1 LLM class F420-dependent oxidoreductase [Alphaproteobacteria bacterium]
MHFGLRYLNTGRNVWSDKAVSMAQAAEEAGFESIWTVDHVVVPKGYKSKYPYAPSGRMGDGNEDMQYPDPLIYMAYLASVTTTIRLATGILIIPQRNPIVAAKQIATLDQLSGGRIDLGIGVGWLEEEFKAIGIPFVGRGKRTDEHIAAMRALWKNEFAEYHGDFVDFGPIFCRPQPKNGSIPIIVGGHSKAAAKRAGRIGDGFFPARGIPHDLFEIVRATAIENNRDPKEIEFTVSVPEDLNDIPELEKIGVKRILIPSSPMGGTSKWASTPDEVLALKDMIQKYASN